MTIEEKITQIFNISTDIERLNIPKYDWRGEALQGVAFVDISTIFPQVIGMSATFDVDLIQKVAEVISKEARARHHEFIRRGKRDRWMGITFSTPNINIVRDPRWGRGQETFGEDPYLTGSMGIAFIKGLQGSHPKYLRVSAEAKHFAVHSGPEKKRHEIDIHVSKKDFYETYLPAFEMCVKEANPEGIMSAYNRLNGVPCSASKLLLQDILREELGFDGYVISDGGAIRDIHKYHHYAENYGEATALALKAGCDIMNPFNLATKVKLKRYRRSVMKAFNEGLITEDLLDKALKRTYRVRFKLGMFDPPEKVPFTQIPYKVINSKEHRDLAREAASKAMVLLKNDDDMLPLDDKINSIAIIGPNADEPKAHYYPHYYSNPPEIITMLNGIKNKVKKTTKISYAKGSELTTPSDSLSKAIELAEKSDMIILVLGLNGEIEGEEGYVLNELRGDRESLELPQAQKELLRKISDTDKPIVLILTGGSAINIDLEDYNLSAILHSWYSGCEGGNAVADVLFGDFNPAGKLPITFYKSVDQLPDYDNYSMINRTYRYYKGQILFPFGFGLSYTEFTFKNLELSSESISEEGSLSVSCEICNTGKYDGEEVIELYLSRSDIPYQNPIRELKRFKRIYLERGKSRRVKFRLNSNDFHTINMDGSGVLESGKVKIAIGNGQPTFTDKKLIGTIKIIGK
ncbi:MAG: glycoside hydrolase family 3 protein [Candidatus Lokiarchaeota archaeon]|nr:glycoside hydrolase family 3 protein [Candidatus Lokiarchaeota archaeon]MBD3199653.1 glycoside hydrolase family 3 protein [Candidatus Lokiarchaeota archaeon]